MLSILCGLKLYKQQTVCLRLLNALGLLSVFVCFDDDICRVMSVFSQKVYLAQSYRGISGDIFAYILHPEAYDFAYQTRHSPRYTDSKNCKKL